MANRFRGGQEVVQAQQGIFKSGAIIKSNSQLQQIQTISSSSVTDEQYKREIASQGIEAIEQKIAEQKAITQAREQSLRDAKARGDTDTVRKLEDSVERQRFISSTIIDNLQSAKSLASKGIYTPESVVAYAMSKGFSRLDRVETKQIIKEQSSKQTQTTTQQQRQIDPNAQYYMTTREGVIDTRTGKIVQPATYVDEQGQPMSIDPKKLREAERQAEIRSVFSPKQIIQQPPAIKKVFSIFQPDPLKQERSERILAYEETAPLKNLSLPAIVRQVPQRLAKSVFGEKAGKFIGETSLYMGFSPVMVTTTGIMKSIKPTEVIFKGASQSIKRNVIQTDVKFLTSQGIKGSARGITLTKELTKGIQKSFTIGAGGTVRTVVMPNRIKIVPEKTFMGFEKAITQEVSGQVKIPMGVVDVVRSTTIYKQFSAGRVITKGITRKLDDFVSFSVSMKNKNILSSIGRTYTKKGESFSAGIIKNLDISNSKDSVIKAVGGKSTKLSKSFSETALKSTQNIVKASFVKPPSISSSSITPTISVSSSAFSSMKVKSYVGTGLYERTQEYGVISPASFSKPTSFITLKTMPISKTIQSSMPKIKTELNYKSLSVLKSSQDLSSNLKLRDISLFKISQKPLQKQKTTQKVTPRLQQRLILKPKPFSPTIIKPISRSPPKIIGFNIPFKPTKKQSSKSSFMVEIKRFGKFKTIGKTSNINKAFSIGTRATRTTLGATFRITPSKKGTGQKNIGTPTGFYKAKGKPLTFIEKRTFRLSTLGEIGEIQIAKRRKKKRR